MTIQILGLCKLIEHYFVQQLSSYNMTAKCDIELTVFLQFSNIFLHTRQLVLIWTKSHNLIDKRNPRHVRLNKFRPFGTEFEFPTRCAMCLPISTYTRPLRTQLSPQPARMSPSAAALDAVVAEASGGSISRCGRR